MTHDDNHLNCCPAWGRRVGTDFRNQLTTWAMSLDARFPETSDPTFAFKKNVPQNPQPSEFITLRARVFTNVRRVFYIIFLSRNSREIRYNLRGPKVINPGAWVPACAHSGRYSLWLVLVWCRFGFGLVSVLVWCGVGVGFV